MNTTKKPKHPGFDAPFLDDEEKAIFEAVERGEYVSVKPRAQALKEWQQAARNTLRKKPITVRVQVRDIAKIKAMALAQGIPYQTLVSSILHRYASGTLKEEA
jgi:predicted DNA binding CopG/RHH family protein